MSLQKSFIANVRQPQINHDIFFFKQKSENKTNPLFSSDFGKYPFRSSRRALYLFLYFAPIAFSSFLGREHFFYFRPFLVFCYQ